jgi:hypothetical protein
MSQVRYILGYRVPRQDSLHEQINVLIQNRAGFKWQVRHPAAQVEILLARRHSFPLSPCKSSGVKVHH